MNFALICTCIEFDISVVDFDINRTQPKIGTNQALKGKIYADDGCNTLF